MKKTINKFSIGTITAAHGNIGYQTINNIYAAGEPWTLIPAIIVIFLAITSIKKQKTAPVLAGYILIIPIATVSLIGILLPITPLPPIVIIGLYITNLITFLGLLYSTLIGIKTITQIT
ncbi:hypothetical protein [Methanonatronarchaeum sp. AMET-Sl]|uniref:hypothetical protein n=1 Tax=Methanonatronarchaeum sp. AMET-Sl TaxID=3037654 RepID=UPI00244E42E7|nr:hypothetical protein [Methanonatronarchaeum sp. AMET-Sl]WGI18032.1 hypothetical protein QEN48_03245 [Methanonatronarchaeum sp. AMET-Sl]